jgi:hypothetical protein
MQYIIERMDAGGRWTKYSSASSESAANYSAKHLKEVYPDWSIRVTDSKGNTVNIL